MITTGIDKRVKVQQIIENQVPEFLLSESPKAVDFLKQYYISQEFQGGVIDLTDNLDQYLKLDNLSPEVVVGETKLTSGITTTGTTINVSSTKGFPKEYGLFKINDEVITYTGLTTNTFTGCIRGFSGITTYHAPNQPNELVFSDTTAINHDTDSTVINLSALFLKEFYKKTKATLTPGLENVDFVNNLDVSNFIKNSKSLYQSKGTEESFRILFNVLYNETPKIIDLEEYLLKPSSAEYIRREIILAEAISGNPINLLGQTIIKSTDSATRAAISASISEIEPLTRKGKTYYKLGLFVGFNEKDLIEGTFTIPGITRSITNVSAGSSVLTVDSTVGFGATGVVISGINTNIYYSSKSLNQFFGCTNIVSPISVSDDVRSDEFYYGYENGDLSKRVDLRITGVLSKFQPTSDIRLLSEGEKITVKNVGEKIIYPDTNRSRKEIFANSWIYNTSSRFQVENINGNNFELFTRDIDKSSIKVGDEIQILFRNEENLAGTGVVNSVSKSTKTIDINPLSDLTGGTFTPDPNRDYDIRRIIKRANSTSVDIEFGDNVLTSDVSNVYNDSNERMYVASNSLPSYTITTEIPKSTIPNATGNIDLQGFNNTSLKFSIIAFTSNVKFITGDEITYTAENNIIPGLEEGSYFVEVLSNKKQIRLYKSRSFIPINDFEEFESLPSNSGSHTFSLVKTIDQKVSAQKLLKEFTLNPNITNSDNEKTIPGATGLLINGVEILNYKSSDRIYSGPIQNIKVLNGGKNYDVITPPTLEVSSSGVGKTTALIRPVVNGEVVDIQVDPQNFDIQKVLSISLEGGNGAGARFEAEISKRKREISFDGRMVSQSGGVDNVNETITFLTDHHISSGIPLVYDKNGNDPLGVGTVGNDGISVVGLGTTTLVDSSVYYPEVLNSRTIKLFQNLGDYNSGINTVGFTTFNKDGVHKFKLLKEQNTLSDIRVLDGGSNYQNRELFVKPSGINTSLHTINFTNHGFSNGDQIVYSTNSGIGSTQPQSISGLSTYTGITSTSVFYDVNVIDKNSFRITNAGLGGTSSSNYDRSNYIKFTDQGTGFQVFKYPDIKLNLLYELANTNVGVITATPVIRGSIDEIYLYESGTGYGSDILNLEKPVNVTRKNGDDAELKPIISEGRISYVEIQSKGKNYETAPDLEVVGIGTGLGAKLRAVVENGKIVNVIILKSGLQYQDEKTKILVKPPGNELKVDTTIRSLSSNLFERYGNEALIKSQEKLKYSIVGYSTQIGSDAFGDNGIEHSPIIGFAYDGNPIYGPYAYSDPTDENSPIRILKSGYELDPSNIFDRPTSFSPGFFSDDYVFKNTGDLDSHNGRYCRTPEYPKGTYAYFVGITSISLLPEFPYFIGDTYRSKPTIDNYKLTQSDFDIEKSNLIRNTYPYKVSDQFADNDFIVESNEISNQVSVVESTSFGSVDSIQIINDGDNYQVGNSAIFDNTDTEGGGLSVTVDSVKGREITSIDTTINTFNNVVFVNNEDGEVSAFISTSPSLSDGDNVVISGLSTTAVVNLPGSHNIGVKTARTTLYQQVPNSATTGVVTDIYVSQIPSLISVGSSIGIGTEKLLVLNTFNQNNILRVKRGAVSGIHTVGTKVELIPNTFDIKLGFTDDFDSKLNDKVFFNPHESIGVGTAVGLGSTSTSTLGDLIKIVSTPLQSIRLPNHKFETNQKVTITKPAAGYALTVSDDDGISTFSIPESGNSQDVFVIRKSANYIGIVTQVGLTTTSNGLSFVGDTKVGSSSFEYSFESNFTQVTGTLERIHAQVSVSTAHFLDNKDIVNLNIKPNQSVGIGTSTSVNLKYDELNNILLINTKTCSSSGITTSSNNINIISHGFETGDKIYYSASTPSEGLSDKNSYFVYKVDDNNFKLGETPIDVKNKPINILELSSTGSNHEFSLINPKIEVVRNNNLVFGVGHSSLQDFEFKFYHDKNFKNEFVSTGTTDTFQVSGVGTIGITSTATVTLNFYEDNPNILFYNVEKSGYISTSDTIDVEDYSTIQYKDSVYGGGFQVFGVVSAATTTFNISLPKTPEKLSYNQSETSELSYFTNAPEASGPINNVKINFGGVGYKSLPSFVSIASTQGVNASLLPDSNTINRVSNVRILNPGFEYSSDNTLRPEAFVSPVISIINSNTISNVKVLSGGKNYTTEPDLVIVNPDTGEVDNTGVVDATINGSAVADVSIVVPSRGLDPVTHKIFALNNSNGSTIKSVEFNSATGIVTCTLVTPILGFSTAPFSVGEEIFVEGIQQYEHSSVTPGNGFNSNENGFNFFKVTSMVNNNPATVEFNLSSLTSNPGIAKTVQNSFAQIISKNDYPQFEVTQKIFNFNIGEKISAFIGDSFVPVELSVSESTDEFIKIVEDSPGAFTLVSGQRIRGANSGNIATINEISENTGQFIVDYSLRQDQGWRDNIGKLNQDYQVLPDNDYYQNLSYSVKSSITYEDLINPVNRLLHTSGLKNFADVGIQSATSAGVTTTTFLDTLALDIIDQKRVDTINNFDFALDIDTVNNKSKFLKLKNTKLSPYIECRTNRVLEIDDISNLFSNTSVTLSKFLDIPINTNFAKYLIQVRNPNNKNIQLSDIVLLKDDNDVFTAEQTKVHNTPSQLGEIEFSMDEAGLVSLIFTPDDADNNDYDIKIFQNTFNTNLAGIGTQSIGFVNLSGSNKIVSTASTSEIISANIGNIDAFFASVEVEDPATSETNFVELYATHDGTNTFVSEFFTDTEEAFTSNFIGTFISGISTGVFSLSFENDEPNEILVRSSVIGIGTTTAGISTYRFKSAGQIDGSERTLRFESNFANVSAATTVSSFLQEEISSFKSIVRVSSGSTSALHQVLVVNNETDTHITQYPFLSIGSTSGIGTFSSTIKGNDLNFNFHPDPEYTGGTNNVQVQILNKAFYKDIDLLNIPLDLQYGTVTESLSLAQYDAINGSRSNKTSFALQHNTIPIFQKNFNPSSVLNLATGLFSITDHFFESGEKIIYSPGSTFTGASVSGITTAGGALASGTELFAIKKLSDTFQVAKTKADALAGIALTFSGFGSGNNHEFEMFKKNEKALLSIDGVVQSPIAFTPITTELEFDISNSVTTFSVTGISSVNTGDTIKINDEYMEITNVGLGTTSVGPITETGSVKILEVNRGYIGSSATNHTAGDTTRLFSGGYNIVDSTIHFTQAPRGTNRSGRTPSNLDPVRSTFNGRVYLRQDYSTNFVFDDISDSFNGTDQAYRVKVGGADTVGINTGSSILLLNGIFQTPTTFNNLNNNYNFSSIGGTATNVIFTGITSSNGSLIISDTDVNQNQLPRGGVIVSLGSTGGEGVAPLVGANVKATTNGSGAIVGVVGIATTGSSYGISTASYNNLTGELEVTTSSNHDFSNINEFVRLDGLTFNPSLSIANDRSFGLTGVLSSTTFTISLGSSTTSHAYVGSGTAFEYLHNLTFGSGYRNPVSVAVTDLSGNGASADISAVAGDGGVLSFTINNNGTGYTKPQIQVSSPSYSNLPITGVSRRGIGNTTDTGTGASISVNVGSSNTSVGIGSTLFTIKEFVLENPGYNFKLGDVFKPVGLVTAVGVTTMTDFELTVLDVFTDQYSSWNFGQFDFIDSIKDLQDGSRTRFPLIYNANLLSFEKEENSLLDLKSLLLIFINGVVQDPGEAYTFDGGTSFEFAQAPDPSDIIDIFFYKGTEGVDAVQVAAGSSVAPTIKVGDSVQVIKNSGITTTQKSRVIYGINASDEVETNLYNGIGIDERNFKPFHWTKQKIDKKINGEFIFKSRDSLESLVYPTAKIISDVGIGDTILYLDNASFFNYEEDFGTINVGAVGGLIVESTDLVAAGLTAIVSAAGTIQSLDITNAGNGYVGSAVTISIAAPATNNYYAITTSTTPPTGLTTATASATISNGRLNTITITNPGFGYTQTKPPQVIAPSPTLNKEDVDLITTVEGFDGDIIGIAVTDGVGGNPLALKFTISADLGAGSGNPSATITDLKVGYPIYIFDTQVGHGVTSVFSDGAIVSTGTTCVDNIYFVDEFNAGVGIITCNIMSGVNTTGIDTSVGLGTAIGGFSWGRLTNLNRSANPISIGVTGKTHYSGISSYPTIQRRDFGLRDSGALRKDLG